MCFISTHTYTCTVPPSVHHQPLSMQQPTPPQPQTQDSEIPRVFSKNMNCEQLALWLCHEVGTDFDEDIAIIKGSVFTCAQCR